MTLTNTVERPHEEDLALLEALPKLPREEQPAVLERLLRSPSPEVRTPAIAIGSAMLTDDTLVRFLRDAADDALRSSALEMFKLRGDKALALGISLLNDRDPDIVIQTILVLDHFRNPRALEPLRKILTHANPNVVQAVIVAIGHIGHAASIEDLLPFLEGDQWLRMAAVQALGDIRAPDASEALAKLLGDPTLGSLAAESLVRIGGPEVFRLLAERWMASADDDAFLELLAHVLEGGTVKPPSVAGFGAAVKKRLEMATGEHQIAAARCLLALGAREADSVALRVLADSTLDRETLPACLAGRADLIGPLLGERGVGRTWGFLLAARYPRSVPIQALAAALSQQRGHEHLGSIAQALGEITAPELGGPLLDFYTRLPADTHFDWGGRLRQHREALLSALEDRTEVPQRTRAVLTAILADSPDEVVAKMVALSPEYRLEALTHVSSWDDVLRRVPWVEWLEEDSPRYGAIAAEVAERAGLRDLLPDIQRLLRERPSHDLVRLVANLKDEESVSMLVGLLGQTDMTLYPFVIDALGKVACAEGRQALRSVIQSGDARWVALAYTALSKCATTEDEPLFRDAVDHEDWKVRLACVEVLGRAGRPEDRPALVRFLVDPVPIVARRVGPLLGK